VHEHGRPLVRGQAVGRRGHAVGDRRDPPEERRPPDGGGRSRVHVHDRDLSRRAAQALLQLRDHALDHRLREGVEQVHHERIVRELEVLRIFDAELDAGGVDRLRPVPLDVPARRLDADRRDVDADQPPEPVARRDHQRLALAASQVDEREPRRVDREAVERQPDRGLAARLVARDDVSAIADAQTVLTPHQDGGGVRAVGLVEAVLRRLCQLAPPQARARQR